MSTSSDTLAPAPLALHNSPSSRTNSPNLNASNNKARASDAAGLAGGAGDAPDITSPHELTAWVEDVLTRLESSFDNMSNQVLDRLETISRRIDTVEQSISDLMEGNLNDPTSTSNEGDFNTSTGSA